MVRSGERTEEENQTEYSRRILQIQILQDILQGYLGVGN
jgi:hypothetical protein